MCESRDSTVADVLLDAGAAAGSVAMSKVGRVVLGSAVAAAGLYALTRVTVTVPAVVLVALGGWAVAATAAAVVRRSPAVLIQRYDRREPITKEITIMAKLPGDDTEAARRFKELRDSGYTGPIDQDGKKADKGKAAEVLKDMRKR